MPDVDRHAAAIDLRPARRENIPDIEALIARSARALLAPWYSARQIEAALGSVFAVDTELIDDGTYFVALDGAAIVACGGWSRRRTLFGASNPHAGADTALDPTRDCARIRAFFVDPALARRGIGAALMRHSQTAAAAAGFRAIELVATLGGEPLYAASGFAVVERFDIQLGGGLKMAAVNMRKQICTA